MLDVRHDLPSRLHVQDQQVRHASGERGRHHVNLNAGFAFLHAENEEAYAWVLEQFSKVVTPKVLYTDRELALMNGIARIFPGYHNILCCWHINKNIFANCKKRFSDVEWQQFMERWNMLVSSTSVKLFDAALGVFKETYLGTHPAAR